MAGNSKLKSRYAAITFHATAVVYTGGTIAQLLKLFLAFPWTEMPFVIDWLIITLGSIGVSGLICFHRSIAYRGIWEQIVHWAIVLHLFLSVALHLWTILQGNHDFYASFPYEYSYFAVLYFGLFAWRSWTVRLRHEESRKAI
jgi:hypothetical protein